MIGICAFAGMIPKTSPALLGAEYAVKAVNCELERGHLAPLKGPEFVAALSCRCATIFRHDQDGWLGMAGRGEIVKSGVHDLAGEESSGQLLITGEGIYPGQYFSGGTRARLALPRPKKAPLATIINGAQAATANVRAFASNHQALNFPRYGQEGKAVESLSGNVRAFAEAGWQAPKPGRSGYSRSTAYCYTYVRYLASGPCKQESAPSPPTGALDLGAGYGARLSGFEIPAGFGITHLRIYRTMGGSFHFVCELLAQTDSYLDAKQDRDISAELLKTSDWDSLPDDARGLRLCHNGMYGAFRGNELLLSVPYHPYAFPCQYRLTLADEIVGLCQMPEAILVLTRGRPYLASGPAPDQIRLERLPFEQGCVAALSIASPGTGAIYASPDGLFAISANESGLVTERTFTVEQWRRLEPEKIMGAILDGKYYAFFENSNRGFIFTPGRPDIVLIELPGSMTVSCLYHHSLDDCLYLGIEKDGQSGVYKWGGGEALPFIWRSRPFFSSRLVAARTLRIEGGQTERQRIEVRLYGPDRKRPRQRFKLCDTRTKRAQPGRAEKIWQLELIGKTRVYEARLNGGVEDLEYGQVLKA